MCLAWFPVQESEQSLASRFRYLFLTPFHLVACLCLGCLHKSKEQQQSSCSGMDLLVVVQSDCQTGKFPSGEVSQASLGPVHLDFTAPSNVSWTTFSSWSCRSQPDCQLQITLSQWTSGTVKRNWAQHESKAITLQDQAHHRMLEASYLSDTCGDEVSADQHNQLVPGIFTKVTFQRQ